MSILYKKIMERMSHSHSHTYFGGNIDHTAMRNHQAFEYLCDILEEEILKIKGNIATTVALVEELEKRMTTIGLLTEDDMKI